MLVDRGRNPSASEVITQLIRNQELRGRVLTTLSLLLLIRLGIYIPLPAIDREAFQSFIAQGGQLIGFSGNTGTSSGALKNDKGAHLHWELYFEDASGKYFLGQNIPPELLKENIDLLFE